MRGIAEDNGESDTSVIYRGLSLSYRSPHPDPPHLRRNKGRQKSNQYIHITNTHALQPHHTIIEIIIDAS